MIDAISDKQVQLQAMQTLQGSSKSSFRRALPFLGPAMIAAVAYSAGSIIFGLTLLVAGLSSSVVGTLAGQVVMQGFVHFTMPLWLRRLITMAPAFIVILMGLPEQKVLVYSRVVQSFGIPFALLPLLYFTAKRAIMGSLVNRKWVTVAGAISATVIIMLNLFVIYYEFNH